MDSILNGTPFNSEEWACISYVADTAKRDEDGRFIIRMPLKETTLQQLG